MPDPLRRKEPAPEGALIRMTRDSPSGRYRKGDTAVMIDDWRADFRNLGNRYVSGGGVCGVKARYYLVIRLNAKEP